MMLWANSRITRLCIAGGLLFASNYSGLIGKKWPASDYGLAPQKKVTFALDSENQVRYPAGVFESQVIQGRLITAADLAEIAGLIQAHPGWSRWRISQTLAHQWDWRNAAGQFPAGTLSGAPKVRAMQIIEELEPVRRGIYGGSVLYADFAGNLDSCIGIRTMLMQGKHAYLQAGAGIVADSDAASEFQE